MPTPARPRPPRARAAAAVALAVALLVSGCGLRWETPDPTEPLPDAAEQARREAVTQALALQDAADGAVAGAPQGVGAVLTLVSATAVEQVGQLGGVYDAGLPDDDASAAPSPSASAGGTSAPPTPADVLALLGTAASQARADARTADDPGLARLLASVAASRAQLASTLAAALQVDAPAVDADPTGGFEAGGSADGSGSGDGSAAGDDATAADGTPDATPSAGPTSPAPTPTSIADDLDRATLLALTAAEDQAGYGFEVAAARLRDADRSAAVTSAATHRSRAEKWAERAGVAGTADDPRRVTYALGADLGSTEAVRAFCASLESDLASVYGDALLVTGSGSDARDATVDALRIAAVAATVWGAGPTALPGLPATAPAPAAAAPSPTADGTPAG